jgi:hypothetical protein
MRFPAFLLLVTLLAGCASSSGPLEPRADHPASSDAPPARYEEQAATLPAAPAPVLPPMLRPAPEGQASDGHAGHRPQADAPAPAHEHPATPAAGLPPLSMEGEHHLHHALTAYLHIADRLADDSMDGVPEQARELEQAVTDLAETGVEGDPHFWHMRQPELDLVRAQARVLADASELAIARQAFGELSPAVARIAVATGAPSGFEPALHRFVCGMADAPEGGVWLQLGPEPRNPYFGAAMLRCFRERVPIAPRTAATGDPHRHH